MRISRRSQFYIFKDTNSFRGGSKTAAITKTEHFVIIVNSWKPLTIITKRSILDVAAVLDPPLSFASNRFQQYAFLSIFPT